jgi:hypothetical protein
MDLGLMMAIDSVRVARINLGMMMAIDMYHQVVALALGMAAGLDSDRKASTGLNAGVETAS